MKQSERIKILEEKVKELQSLNKQYVVGKMVDSDTIVVTDKPKFTYLPPQFWEETRLERRFEKGNWYTNGKLGLVYCKRISTTNGKPFMDGYGFHSKDGTWFDEESELNVNCDKWVQATSEQIETALINEAERIGFKSGVTIDQKCFGFRTTKLRNGVTDSWAYNPYDNWLSWRCVSWVFKDGKWAEIIEDTLTINGETMKVDGDIVSFGCAKFHKEQLEAIHSAIDIVGDKAFNYYKETSNCKIVSIKLDSGVELTIEDLKLIVNKLN